MSPKVLLIYPGASYRSYWAVTRRSTRSEMLVLYSYLRNHNVTIDVLDFDIEIGFCHGPEDDDEYRQRVKRLIRNQNFDIAAISCYSSACYQSTQMLAEICREVKKDCTIVVGGYHPTALPEDFYEPLGMFDFVVRNEGEEALLEICRGWPYKKADVPQVIEGYPLNMGVRNNFNAQGYRYRQPWIHTLGISFTRGCPFACHYCVESNNPYYHEEYPVDLALKHLENLIEMFKLRCVCFDDALFPAHTRWGEEFLTKLARAKRKIIFYFLARAELLKPKQIELLSKVNTHLHLGLESGSPFILEAMNKTVRPDSYLQRSREVIARLNELNVWTNIGLIFNFPGDNHHHVRETFNYLRSIFVDSPTVSIDLRINRFSLIPGSYIWNNMDIFEKKYGSIFRNKDWWRQPGYGEQMSEDIIPSREFDRPVQWKKEADRFVKDVLEPKAAIEPYLLKSWLNKHVDKSQHECSCS